MNSSRHPSASLKPSFQLSALETGQILTHAEPPAPHRGWHSRGYLPHWDHPALIQSINFRLADSMPHTIIEGWLHELAQSSRIESQRTTELRRRIDEYLDAHHGACWMQKPEIAQLVENALLHFDSKRYRLLAWCIMPNHVHVLIETFEGFALSGVVHSWKSYTSIQANRLIGRHGAFGQRDYQDRYIRNAQHYDRIISYIEGNPVKARLVETKTDWPWSSARYRSALEAPA